MDIMQNAELSHLLARIATEFQNHEGNFEARTLDEWPEWCEENGYSFEILCGYGAELLSRLPSQAEAACLRGLVTSAAKSTKTGELCKLIQDAHPGLIELLEQDLSQRYKEVEEIGSMPGGSGHEALEIAGIATGVLITGLVIKKFISWLNAPVMREGVREKLERLEGNWLQSDKGHHAQERAEQFIAGKGYPNLARRALEKSREKIEGLEDRIDRGAQAAEYRAKIFTKQQIGKHNQISPLKSAGYFVKGKDINGNPIKIRKGTQLEKILEEQVDEQVDNDISHIAAYEASEFEEEFDGLMSSVDSALIDEINQGLEKAKTELVDEADKAIISLEKQEEEEIESKAEGEIIIDESI